MLKLFTPNYYIHNYSALRCAFLKEHGIRLLLCDIDNTLIPHDVAKPDEAALAFIKRIQESGITLAFISNNVEERVVHFAQGLDIVCYPFALKPLPKTYKLAIRELQVDKQHVAVLGDQLMTDILGANLAGLYTILTAPVVERDLSFTKVNRIIEGLVFKLLKISKRLTKGDFNE